MGGGGDGGSGGGDGGGGDDVDGSGVFSSKTYQKYQNSKNGICQYKISKQ
jgi:hypothetical protein